MKQTSNIYTSDINKTNYIGVFDSGMGGISTLIELKKLMPNENFYYFGDSENAPYGPKTKDEILRLSLNVSDFLYSKKIKALVVACNTATSVAINDLREKYPNIPVIGVEPAIKLGVDMGSKNILVMATQTTVSQSKFLNLKKTFNKSCDIKSIACPKLVEIVENDLLDDSELCKKTLLEYFNQFDMNKIDTIVLGCTHFIFYKEYIKELLGDNYQIIDGNLGTAKHLKAQLEKMNLSLNTKNIGEIEFMNSQIIDDNTNVIKIDLSRKLFENFI